MFNFFKKKPKNVVAGLAGKAADKEVVYEIGDILARSHDDLSQPEDYVLTVLGLERQINNGGFDQYFFNASGDHVYTALDALKAIKADATADLLQKAIEAFPSDTVPSDEKERRDLMKDIPESISNIWDDLDNRFYEYQDDIATLLLDYIKENIESFR